VLGLDEQGLLVACGHGVLAIRRLQLPGRRIVQARDFANAADPIGSRLGL
jgi:methionyl-tRNA formyltransferase